MATICIATKNNEDDQEEICCTNIGIVSGVGSIELLEPVNAKFNQIVELSSSDVPERIVRKERRRFSMRYPQVPDEYAEQVKNTWWIFSCRQLNYDKRELTLELRVIDLLSKLLRADKKNHPYLLPAFGATKQDLLDITGSLKGSIKSYEDFESLRDSIEYHWKKIHLLIQDIHPKFSSISSCSQVGFCTIDGIINKSRIAKNIDGIPSLTKELIAAPRQA